MKLSPDIPLCSPEQDEFGYSTLSSFIADSIISTENPNGIVISINAPWGYGKSSLMNFISYYISERSPEIHIVNFNPWWFSSRENLVNQFFAEFGAQIKRNPKLKKITSAIGEYAGVLGQAAAIGSGYPIITPIANFFGKGIKSILKKDVQRLKNDLASDLKKSGNKFVFFIDDIDRLTPEEIKELFKIVKVLADFPNVIYILSFDMDIVCEAINLSYGIDGKAYLEKIIQASFSLPKIDKLRLRRTLFSKLWVIGGESGFKENIWHEVMNVYFSGLDSLIRNPRDIIRVTNALNVTYPPVKSEIFSPDFVAIEFIRIFCPKLYTTIKSNKKYFAGPNDERHTDREELIKFHNAWLENIDEVNRNDIKTIVQILFPKLNNIFGNTIHGSNWVSQWRKERRICSDECFDIYFNFTIDSDFVSKTELEIFKESANEERSIIGILESSTEIYRLDGTNKVQEYISKIRDIAAEIDEGRASNIIKAIFNCGNKLLTTVPETRVSLSSLPFRWYIDYTIEDLLEKIPEDLRGAFLIDCTKSSSSLTLLVEVIRFAERVKEEPDKRGHSSYNAISDADLAIAKDSLCERLASSTLEELLSLPNLDMVLFCWGEWADNETVNNKIRPILENELSAIKFLATYFYFSQTFSFGDALARSQAYLNSRSIQKYINVGALEEKLKSFPHESLSRKQLLVVDTFLKDVEARRNDTSDDSEA